MQTRQLQLYWQQWGKCQFVGVLLILYTSFIDNSFPLAMALTVIFVFVVGKSVFLVLTLGVIFVPAFSRYKCPACDDTWGVL